MSGEWITDEGANNLRFAIVEQAVKDYTKLLSEIKKRIYVHDKTKWELQKLERWFRSDNFKYLCDLDGEEIMKRCQKRVDELWG